MESIFWVIGIAVLIWFALLCLNIGVAWVEWRCRKCGQRLLPFSFEDKYIAGPLHLWTQCGDCFSKEDKGERERLRAAREKDGQ